MDKWQQRQYHRKKNISYKANTPGKRCILFNIDLCSGANCLYNGKNTRLSTITNTKEEHKSVRTKARSTLECLIGFKRSRGRPRRWRPKRGSPSRTAPLRQKTKPVASSARKVRLSRRPPPRRRRQPKRWVMMPWVRDPRRWKPVRIVLSRAKTKRVASSARRVRLSRRLPPTPPTLPRRNPSRQQNMSRTARRNTPRIPRSLPRKTSSSRLAGMWWVPLRTPRTLS